MSQEIEVDIQDGEKRRPNLRSFVYDEENEQYVLTFSDEVSVEAIKKVLDIIMKG